MRRLDGMNVHVNATKEYRKGPSRNAGRDPSNDWQSRGQGFKSPQLHFWNPQ
jgi:hypothetical protein